MMICSVEILKVCPALVQAGCSVLLPAWCGGRLSSRWSRWVAYDLDQDYQLRRVQIEECRL